MFKHKKIIAITASVAVHAALLAAIIIHDLFGLYSSVKGFEIGDFGGQATVRIINPADYGYGRKPKLEAPPRSADKLEDVKRREEARRASKAEADQEAAREREQKPDDEQESQEQAAPAQEQSAQERKPLAFGRIDTHPIKQHITMLWQAHEAGQLDLPDTFRITAACKVNEDGSFSDIRLVESSGSQEVDRTALAILHEVGNQRAFAPLSRLSSVSVRLEVGSSAASFSIVGFAPNAAVASDMAGQYQTLISAAKLLAPNAQSRTLLSNASVKSDASRVSARLTLPRSAASEMMAQSFSKSQ